MYRPNFYESTCFRCNEIVYQVDRVGPLKDFTFFHSGCFKCAVCGTKLTLKVSSFIIYFSKLREQTDHLIYGKQSVYQILTPTTHQKGRYVATCSCWFSVSLRLWCQSNRVGPLMTKNGIILCRYRYLFLKFYTLNLRNK